MLRLFTVLCESSKVNVTDGTVENVKYSTREWVREILSGTVVATLSAILILSDVITQFRNIIRICIFFKYIFYRDTERDVLREM